MTVSTKSSTALRLPKPYISWSQLSLFERDPQLYARVYLFGDRQSNPLLNFGSEVAKVLEDDTETADREMEFLRQFMPAYPEREVEFRTYLRDDHLGAIPLLGKVDGYHPKKQIIGEYKTGRARWTQGKVDKHGQLTFYALLHYLREGVPPKEMFLHWAQTQINEDGSVSPTGAIKTFRTSRSVKDILAFIPRITAAVYGIDQLMRQEADRVFGQ